MAELGNDTLEENIERFLIHNEDHVKLVNHIACYIPDLCVTRKSTYEQHRFTKQEMFLKWCNLTYDPFSQLTTCSNGYEFQCYRMRAASRHWCPTFDRTHIGEHPPPELWLSPLTLLKIYCLNIIG